MMMNQDRVHSQTPELLGHKVKVGKVFDEVDGKYKGLEIEYAYDFGDAWYHVFEVVRRGDAEGFRVLDGEGQGVAEDVGLWEGWLELREAFRAGRPSYAQRQRMEWYKNTP